jgi:ABC-type protease/lipase transport system fused ATPase/permease subunit
MLSGGQRQRMAWRAPSMATRSLVLDEPNSSLDEAGDAALLKLPCGTQARGTTFVVMTHRTSVLAVADKMLVLRDGIQQAFGPRDEVLAALQKASEAGRPLRSTQQPGHLAWARPDVPTGHSHENTRHSSRAACSPQPVGLPARFLMVGVFSLVANVLMLTPTLYMLQVYDRVLTSRSELTLLAVSLITLSCCR